MKSQPYQHRLCFNKVKLNRLVLALLSDNAPRRDEVIRVNFDAGYLDSRTEPITHEEAQLMKLAQWFIDTLKANVGKNKADFCRFMIARLGRELIKVQDDEPTAQAIREVCEILLRTRKTKKSEKEYISYTYTEPTKTTEPENIQAASPVNEAPDDCLSQFISNLLQKCAKI